MSEIQIKPVQKQTRAGQRTRFKAIVVIGDSEGHVGLGIKTSKEVATAIRAAIIIAKLSVLPIRRGYWGTSLGEPHSLPTKESGKCGSVTVRVRSTFANPSLTADDSVVDPSSPWNGSCCFACRETSPATCWCSRYLHILLRLHQDTREYAQSHFCCRWQYVRLLNTQSMERDKTQPESIGGIW